ncbi:MAG: glycosyltransferase, partial [Candidatus Heimdallarchaeota archaeon]|nr:glycosyltransferase [Candidatus Heimdallarchaeota archaeon]MCK4611459.1 glycosyltransferase [Candidatus Heimdallarchaeota archaeon]
KKKKSEKIRFGFIGRIIPVKGVHLIIDAFNKITNPEVELYIYGSSSTENYLKDRATNPNIHFSGSYNNWEIADVLSEIDVVIVPSIWFENSPLVIHEAAIAKIPIITTNLGGMAEYVKDEVNGLLFERNNVNDLLNKILKFVNEPDLIAIYGNNAIHVQSAEEHTNYVEKLYQSLLEE